MGRVATGVWSEQEVPESSGKTTTCWWSSPPPLPQRLPGGGRDQVLSGREGPQMQGRPEGVGKAQGPGVDVGPTGSPRNPCHLRDSPASQGIHRALVVRADHAGGGLSSNMLSYR